MKRRITRRILCLSLLFSTAALAVNLDRFNVVWNSPSKDSLDAMPLSGRLGAGANVWVQDGSIWLYLAHNGAYDEQGRLLNLGCVRLTPVGLNLGGAGYIQKLDLTTGTILIKQGDFSASLWFAGETLIVESTASQPRALDVAFGSWRDQKRDGIRYDIMGAKGSFSPDEIKADANGFVWSHRNANFPVDVVGLVKGQGITAVAVPGGISNPVESAVEWQFWSGKAWTGRTPARFPAIFGPGHDWLPDHNWGGSGSVGIQEMLLAPEPGPTGKLNLFPAWLPEWDVDFKPHAPGQTVVEAVPHGGKLVSLNVTPEARAKDIVNWLGKQPAYQPPLPVPLSQGKPEKKP